MIIRKSVWRLEKSVSWKLSECYYILIKWSNKWVSIESYQLNLGTTVWCIVHCNWCLRCYRQVLPPPITTVKTTSIARSNGHHYSWLEFQIAHDKVLAEHYKTSDSLKTTTADNRVLISQHQNALQRERDQWNNRMAEQERELEKYRNEMAQEVAREKDKQQYLENEKYSLLF